MLSSPYGVLCMGIHAEVHKLQIGMIFLQNLVALELIRHSYGVTHVAILKTLILVCSNGGQNTSCTSSPTFDLIRQLHNN